MKIQFTLAPWESCNTYLNFYGTVESVIWLLPSIRKLKFKHLISNSPYTVNGFMISVTISWLFVTQLEIDLRIAKAPKKTV